MKKNVASQVVGVQMVNASDGSAFTGAVTVYVTGDGGTQALGSVGSGACTHEGNGFHTYAPAQAETNYNHIAFTFIGAGAIPATLQVYTNFPQTGDTYAQLPTNFSDLAIAIATGYVTVGTNQDKTGYEILGTKNTLDDLNDITAAAVRTEVDANSTQLAAIVADTNELQVDWTNGGRLDLLLDGVKAVTDVIPDSGAMTSIATAAAVTTVDTVVDAIKVKTDSLTFTDAGKIDATLQIASDLKAAVANRIADHTLRRSLATALASSDGDTKSFRSLAGAASKQVNKIAISGSNLITYETDDTTTLGTQTVTTSASADPVTGLDTV